jgi:hypothetical protein
MDNTYYRDKVVGVFVRFSLRPSLTEYLETQTPLDGEGIVTSCYIVTSSKTPLALKSTSFILNSVKSETKHLYENGHC